MKYSAKMKSLRLTSLLLCALMLLLSCPIAAIADDTVSAGTTATETEQTIESTTQSTLAQPTLPDEILEPGELTYEELQTLRVEDVARPETVTLEMAQAAQHVNRLEEQENNLRTVIFQNRGGGKTAYVYTRPVKYVTADGKIRDKDTAITESNLAGYAYAMTDNSVKVYFAPLASGGVVVEYAEHSMRMIPEGGNLVSTATRGEGDNVILYNNAFGARTALRYQTELGGVKEDIVLLQNVGKNTFRFLLTTALTPTQRDGTWTLTDEAGVVVMTLGEIVVKDSAGKTAYGTLNITPRAQGGYIMTVTAPQEFLTASDTVYPVYIDPTTTVDEIGYYETYEGSETFYNGYDSIVDVGLYNSTTEYQAALADSSYHRLSLNGRVIYKLPDFYEAYGLFASRNAKQIGTVTLHLPFARGVSGIIGTTIPSLTWDEETTPIALNDADIWNSQVIWFDTNSQIDTTSGQYSLDITELARSWCDYSAGDESACNPENGFSLLSSFSSPRRVAAVEASSTVGDIYYTVDYDSRGGLYYIRNTAAQKYLVRGNSAQVTVTDDLSLLSLWMLDYQGDGKYVIYNDDDETPRILARTGSTAPMPTAFNDYHFWTIASASGGGVVFTSFTTGKVLCYNGTSVTTVTARQSTSSNYTQTTWAIGKMMESFKIQADSWIEVGDYSQSTILSTPSHSALIETHYFMWSSSNTFVATVDDNGIIDGVGEGYAYITAIHAVTGLSASCMVHVGSVLSDGVYFIQNLQSSLYVNVEGDETQSGTDGAFVEQATYWGRDKSMQWYIHHIGGNNYSIKSMHSNMYLSLATQSNSTNLSIVQSDVSMVESDNVWKIYEGNRGYIIQSAYSVNTSMVLRLPSEAATEGANLIQGAYQDDNVYSDEWGFTRLKDAALLVVHEEEVDRSSYFGEIEDFLDSIGYTDVYNNHSFKENGLTGAEIREHILTSKITLIRTHGSKNGIQCSSRDLGTISFARHPQNYASASELVIYATCLAGSGGVDDYNMVTVTAQAGARTVIGFEDSVYTEACNDWCEKFFELYVEYCDDPDKDFNDLLQDVDEEMRNHPLYDGVNEDGERVSLARYVIAGEITFP